MMCPAQPISGPPMRRNPPRKAHYDPATGKAFDGNGKPLEIFASYEDLVADVRRRENAGEL